MYGQTSTSKRIDPLLCHIKGKPRDDGMLDRYVIQNIGRAKSRMCPNVRIVQCSGIATHHNHAAM